MMREEAKQELLSDEFGENVSDDDSEEQAEPTAIRSSYSLLIVEDNEELLQLMTKLLGADYMVYTANNGKEAIDVVEQEEIDLIVSDVMMPEMDGIEFCQYIKNKFETSHIPVVLLTAKNKEEDRVDTYVLLVEWWRNAPPTVSEVIANRSLAKDDGLLRQL